MKKLILIISCLLFITACTDDFTLAEKEIFVKKIPIFVFYGNSFYTIPTPKGFYVQTQKSYTNGDSTKCEIIAKIENITSKIDFNGNIVWQKINNEALPYTYSTDDEGNFYSLNYSSPFELSKYDSLLNVSTKTPLLFSKYTDKPITVQGIEHWKEGKMLGYGQIFISNGSNPKYKQFLCILSIQNGIEKFVLDDTERGYTNNHYKIYPSGEVYGLETSSVNQVLITTLRKYDADFKVVASKEILLPNNNLSTVIFNENGMYAIKQDYVLNKASLLFFDRNFEAKEEKIEISPINFSFVKASNKQLFLVNNTSNVAVFRIENNLSLKKISDLDSPTFSPYIKVEGSKNIIYSLNNGKNYSKPSLEFVRKISGEPSVRKIIYESQYSRNCFRYE